MKMPAYGTDKGASDRGEFDTNRSEYVPQELRLDAAKRALKSANEKLRQSTRYKKLVIRYGYNEYKWVYKIKYNVDGSINRYKARYKTHGINYDKTFAPIAKMTIVRVMVAVATARGWRLH